MLPQNLNQEWKGGHCHQVDVPICAYMGKLLLLPIGCTVMVGMLEMCKVEMATANKADATQSILVWIAELESIHGRQRKMLTTLHEKLLEFR
jgi:hypothetical protein